MREAILEIVQLRELKIPFVLCVYRGYNCFENIAGAGLVMPPDCVGQEKYKEIGGADIMDKNRSIVRNLPLLGTFVGTMHLVVTGLSVPLTICSPTNCRISDFLKE